MAGKISKIGWYWHRLRAMEPKEVALRLQKKVYQFSDARFSNPVAGALDVSSAFPRLPRKEDAPPELLQGLRQSADETLRGEWKAFGHLPLKVDDPPKWQHDYLVGRDMTSGQTAFKLDHRAQPGGADIKVIWEPSRWNQLVRLAMAAWLLGDTRAQEKCVEWLHDWTKRNPAFTGLNWTSGLETGIRLIQFAWIDALLEAAGAPHKTLDELRRLILPAHVWYTWRYRSFGSSANNHLIGELAGIILALARWPEVAAISCSLEHAAALMEKEILAQFAEDGGNKEQAIGYHLFSFEFCFQSQRALEAHGLSFSPEANERLRKAGVFYAHAKPEGDPWEFGDCDNAYVTPLFAEEANFAREWWRWFNQFASSPALRFWFGDFRGEPAPQGWQIFPSSGLAVCRSGDWFLRFDFSPLGYLSIAPHGHLDALHLSVWHRGNPVIVDPGTGAYYADKAVRNYLADWASHNGPHLKAPPEPFPARRGTFLWARHHSIPTFSQPAPDTISAGIALPHGTARRSITVGREIVIRDEFVRSPGALVSATWKFAPELRIVQCGPSAFHIQGGSERLKIAYSGGWKMARSFNPPEQLRGKVAPLASQLGSIPLDSLVSPAFRSVAAASYLCVESGEAGPFELTISAG